MDSIFPFAPTLKSTLSTMDVFCVRQRSTFNGACGTVPSSAPIRQFLGL